MQRQMTFTQALVEYFGKRQGETLPEFTQEIKALTPADRAYFKAEFAKVGYVIIENRV